MSQFLKNTDEYIQGNVPEINFDDAVRLPGGGSTCDIYRTRWQRREVFVKRLKEEFRSKPLYLDALDKEYDIGVKLRHPSLPEYREFHRDYIVMDYIDGMTLAEMIAKCDPWLTYEEHIISMLKELIDVVDYLHRHNVVHCDIKPDNIMITARGKNLVLIDFDKSYSDALSDTSGHPGRYGLPVDETGNTLIDYHGIAGVVESLKANVPGFRFRRYKRFIKACHNPDVNHDTLVAILDYKPSSSHLWAIIPVAGLIIVGVLALLYFNSNKPETAETTNADTIAVSKVDTDTTGQIAEQTSEAEETQGVGTVKDSSAVEKKKAKLLDPLIKPYFQEMHTVLDEFLAAKRSSEVTPDQIFAYLRRVINSEKECMKTTLDVIQESFPGTSEQEVWRILTFSKEFDEYMKRSTHELQACGLFAINPYDKIHKSQDADPTDRDKSSKFIYRTKEELHAEAKKNAAIFDRRIQPMYDALLAGHNKLMQLKNDTTLTGQQMLDSIRRFSDVENSCFADARKILHEMFPDLTEREYDRIMHYSRPNKEYMRRTGPEQKEYGLELERRFKAVGGVPQ